MYVINRNIKIFSFTLIILGLFGIGYGFYKAPKTIEESIEIMAGKHHEGHKYDLHKDPSLISGLSERHTLDTVRFLKITKLRQQALIHVLCYSALFSTPDLNMKK